MKNNNDLNKELEGKVKLINEMKDRFVKEKLTSVETTTKQDITDTDIEYKKSIASLSAVRFMYFDLIRQRRLIAA